MATKNTKATIITYLAIVFAVSSILYVIIHRNGGLEGAGEIFALPLMWTPGLAALLTTFIYQRNFRGLGWGAGKLKYYLVAYFLPIFYAGIIYLLAWFTGLGGLDTTALGGNLAPEILKALTLGVLGAALLALGEEIGWRGLLVPRLAKLQPYLRTVLISGIIWGAWHIPLIIGGGGYSSNAPTWFAIACFMVLVIGISFVFAWLRLASGSIWPGVLMHATHNTFIQSVLDKLTIDNGSTQYFTTEFGLGLAIMGILIGFIFWRVGNTLDLQKIN